MTDMLTRPSNSVEIGSGSSAVQDMPVTAAKREERRIRVSVRPITFDQWVDLGGKELFELVSGVLVEMMAANIEHERLFGWLYRLTSDYVEARNLGEVFGSRTAVRISEFGGRLPDIVFIATEDAASLESRGIYAAPRMIIEVLSPGNRISDEVQLEAEYRTIGVQEIWFANPMKRCLRMVEQVGGEYIERVFTTGVAASSAIPGFAIQVEWLWDGPRPSVRAALRQIPGMD